MTIAPASTAHIVVGPARQQVHARSDGDEVGGDVQHVGDAQGDDEHADQNAPAHERSDGRSARRGPVQWPVPCGRRSPASPTPSGNVRSDAHSIPKPYLAPACE